jgi:hypothetical protein
MTDATLRILEQLPETRDVNDNPIELGARVRSFDFAHHDGIGRDLEGERAAYVEGVVEGSCEDFGDCTRYAIRVERQVAGGLEVDHLVGERVFPPLNGTKTWLGSETCGVEKIVDVGE